MAITKIWALHASLKAAVQYIENVEKTKNVDIKSRIADENDFLAPAFSDKTDIQIANLSNALSYVAKEYKTEEKRLVSGINCTAENALSEMNKEKEYYGKLGGVVGYHCVQSFMPGEIDPDHAHLIGIELAQRVWGDSNYQVVVATHIDREHIHNHFIINSVSLDGQKNPCCYHRKISAISDDIIRQHGLSIITERGISPAVLPHYSKRQLAAKMIIDEGIALCSNLKEFENYMSARGYTLGHLDEKHKYWTVQHKDWERPTRLIRFGDEYSNEKILYRLEHEYIVMPSGEQQSAMSPYQLYMYENRYNRIQRNWKDTYQYKHFMFMLRNFGINLNDFKVHPEHYTRQQKKDYEQIWKSLKSITLLNELDVRTEKDVEAAITTLNHKISYYEGQLQQLQNKLRGIKMNPSRSDEEYAVRSNIEQLKSELKELRSKLKLLQSITEEPIISSEPTLEIGVEPEK